jgi:UDP-N-acetylglucosamine--N-acetylmuramyl-(pentapeptide) pyrophosphoryl-undecaprenol N-acetylglucosamine transferase
VTTYLLAGGGTAGHVNPLLATADALRAADPECSVLALGTAEGLEARLVPLRGYELLTVEKLPFPRRLNRAALTFPFRLAAAVRVVRSLIKERNVDAVVGFGGYAAAPAYLAARREKIPLVIHESNAKPGIANKLGSRLASAVGVAYSNAHLRDSTLVGMPLRHEIEVLDRPTARAEGYREFGLDPALPTLLVTGGSTGARSINSTVSSAAPSILAAGWQVLHIGGMKAEVGDLGLSDYHFLNYCDRMDLAIAVADFAVSRAGSATVSEFSAVGVPAVYVPYPVGNGEQRFNAVDAVGAGAAILLADAEFTVSWVTTTLIPLLRDRPRIAAMAAASVTAGIRDGAARMVALITSAVTAA